MDKLKEPKILSSRSELLARILNFSFFDWIDWLRMKAKIMGANLPTLATISAAFIAVAAIETIPYSVRGEVIATYDSGHPDEAGIIMLEENNTRDRSFKTNSSILLSSGNCYSFTVDRSLLDTDRIVDAARLLCPELP